MLTGHNNKARTSAKGGKHKLAALLAAAVLALPVVAPALASIDNAVVATGSFKGQPVTATTTEQVGVQSQIATLRLEKSAVVQNGGDGTAEVGDSIVYTFDITNTGNVTLRNVALTDPLVAVGNPLLLNDVAPANDSIDTSAANWFNLAPGDTIRHTTSYSLTEADIAASRVTNTATVTASTIPGLLVTTSDTVVTPFNERSAILLEKTATLDLGSDGKANPGDQISYQFTVTNTGTTVLTDVHVDDPLVNMASRPGMSAVVALLETVSGGVDSITTASISSIEAALHQPYWSFQKPRRNASPELPTALYAGRKLVRLSPSADVLVAGERIGIYFELTNAGEGPLTGLRVSQSESEAFGDSADILPANTTDATRIIFTHVLTEAEIIDGELKLPAHVSARSRHMQLALTLNDSLSLADFETLGELATASITPTSVASLEPGAQTIFTATYSISQGDIDAGHRTNSAIALATDPQSASVSSPDSADTVIPQAPAIALVKSGTVELGADAVASVGDVITYHFKVANTGNTTINDIQVSDPLPNLVMAGGPLNGLAPGAEDTTTFTATYVLTQADIDAGKINNQATVNGKTATGTPVTDTSDDVDLDGNDPTSVALEAKGKIALVKTIDEVSDENNNGMTDLGDKVTYAFSVKNEGNVTLANVYVKDRNDNVTSTPLPPTGITLAPGALDETSFKASYVLTQEDVDRGFFDNTADAFGTTPDGTVAEDESDPAVYTENAPTHLEITEKPSIAIVKRVASISDNNGNGITDLNDVINYAFTVTNTGNVTLNTIVVTDPNAVMAGGPLASLAPGIADATTFTATHLVTSADMQAGSVINQATARSDAVSGSAVSDVSDSADITEDDPTVTPIIVKPAIALVKRARSITNTNGNGLVDAGDTIVYEFIVTNTGNVSLSNIQISDPLVLVSGVTIASLDAVETDATTFTATYVIQPADVIAGRVINQATVRGTGPTNQIVTDTSDNDSITGDDPTVTFLANAPAIALVKTQSSITDVNGNGTNDVGDRINYSFAVTNTGNVALTNVRISDNNGVVSGGPLANLALNAVDTTTFTAIHVITQADVDAAGVLNQATATADSTAGAVSDLSDSNNIDGTTPTYTALTQQPAIALVKKVAAITDANSNGRTDAGDTISYAFTVYNTGNTTLSNITITDGNAKIDGGPLATLAVGAADSRTFIGRHLVTTEDEDAGQVVNQAQVQGETPGGVVVQDMSDDESPTGSASTVTPVSAPLAVLSKTAARSEVRRGEKVVYTITASNLRIGPYDIADLMPTGFSFVPGSAIANGAAIIPATAGNTLSFANISPVAGKITIKLSLLASTSLSTGRFVNRAKLFLNATGQQLANAEALVTIKEEHVFDCGEIIGRVFDDLNNNGYHDDGEPGMPGVRVATVKGVLVTTDAHGRFHITCADVPNALIGSNFLMKLDTRSLPGGYQLTTENPRDVRLTRGKIVKLNFGVSKRRDIALDLTRDAFTGGTDLKPVWAKGIDRLVALLKQGRGGLTITYRCGEYAPVVDERLQRVQDLVQARWIEEGGKKPLKIKTSVECGK